MMRLTPVVKNLLTLHVGVFLLQVVFNTRLLPNGNHWDSLMDYMALWDMDSGMFQPYQFLSSIFIHGSFGHIFRNMLVLFFFGPILEQVIGDKKFLLFYLVCGLGAAFSHFAVNEYIIGNPYVAYGASGATMGVLIAAAILYPNIEVQIYFLFPLKLKYLALLLLAYDLYGGLSGITTGVGHFAHLGGALFGAGLIYFWKQRGELRT